MAIFAFNQLELREKQQNLRKEGKWKTRSGEKLFIMLRAILVVNFKQILKQFHLISIKGNSYKDPRILDPNCVYSIPGEQHIIRKIIRIKSLLWINNMAAVPR